MNKRIRLFLFLFFAFSGSALPAQGAGQLVAFSGEKAGTIVVRTGERRLYLVLESGQAFRYPVGVGRAGKQWSGATSIVSKRWMPAWSPPAEIRKDRPSIPSVIPAGSPRNPMGVAALVLAEDEYAIHGTNAPDTVGRFVSYGCIRMHNSDIADLFHRVNVGTRVVVTK
jgi:lipoprotein-anchoring transpeptidase ErfK/SrfK